MSFWAKLFGRRSQAKSGRYSQERNRERKRSRELLLSESSKQIVQSSLARIEAAGLRINPKLNRDLVIVRCLHDFANQYGFCSLSPLFLPQNDTKPQISLDLLTLWSLASETDVFRGFDKFEITSPQLSFLSKDALKSMLDTHSLSVFENAAAICIVNEHEPQGYLQQQIEDLCGLAGGDFQFRSIHAWQEKDRLRGIATLTNGPRIDFDFSAEKRPDLTAIISIANTANLG